MFMLSTQKEEKLRNDTILESCNIFIASSLSRGYGTFHLLYNVMHTALLCLSTFMSSISKIFLNWYVIMFWKSCFT